MIQNYKWLSFLKKGHESLISKKKIMDHYTSKSKRHKSPKKKLESKKKVFKTIFKESSTVLHFEYSKGDITKVKSEAHGPQSEL